jgi:hypothetical protein
MRSFVSGAVGKSQRALTVSRVRRAVMETLEDRRMLSAAFLRTDAATQGN